MIRMLPNPTYLSRIMISRNYNLGKNVDFVFNLLNMKQSTTLEKD